MPFSGYAKHRSDAAGRASSAWIESTGSDSGGQWRAFLVSVAMSLHIMFCNT